MATWSLTSNAAVAGATGGQLLKSRLAMTAIASVVASPAAWPYVLLVAGDLTGTIPYFDAPIGWPRPVLPTP